ncbi:hypothetical protein [Geofilum rubicundum]|uniref:hypothetical protein n=1 Tax=Geofilum rubicundum TaxID=472113 RepID=UPI000781B74E|nr:hypothetical protein [Geofilum rubicundum]
MVFDSGKGLETGKIKRYFASAFQERSGSSNAKSQESHKIENSAKGVAGDICFIFQEDVSSSLKTASEKLSNF